MAKKSRKSARITGQTKAEKAKVTTEADLTAEYRYVTDDLRRIGIIAAILIAGLFALSFIF